MGNIHVKLYEIRTSGSGELSFKEKVYAQTDKRAFRSGELKKPLPHLNLIVGWGFFVCYKCLWSKLNPFILNIFN